MVIKAVYVDTCVYINLWGNEESRRNAVIAAEFFDYCEKNKIKVYFSEIISKELVKIIGEAAVNLFKDLSKKLLLEKLEISENDFFLAKSIYLNNSGLIGLYDAIHLYLTKRSDSVLITRDFGLTTVALSMGVNVMKPEEFI